MDSTKEGILQSKITLFNRKEIRNQYNRIQKIQIKQLNTKV